MMYTFKKTKTAFNYVFERELSANETVIVEVPSVTPDKRGVSDIGWQTNGDAVLYGTLSSKPETSTALWQEIQNNDEINKTVSAIKIVNGSAPCRIAIRILMN